MENKFPIDSSRIVNFLNGLIVYVEHSNVDHKEELCDSLTHVKDKLVLHPHIIKDEEELTQVMNPTCRLANMTDDFVKTMLLNLIKGGGMMTAEQWGLRTLLEESICVYADYVLQKSLEIGGELHSYLAAELLKFEDSPHIAAFVDIWDWYHADTIEYDAVLDELLVLASMIEQLKEYKYGEPH